MASRPRHCTGHWGYLTRGKTAPCWPNNTTSNNNSVFPGGLPIQVQTKPTLA
uniref:Uncharacterized protein n=1 Tax=Anguilla anguilla TaxID=7936 RepID=A0A0E9U7F2_ANGAN